MTQPNTIDWVEAVTGESGASPCERHGHVFVQDSEGVPVNGHPAAYFRCSICGHRVFQWYSDRAGG